MRRLMHWQDYGNVLLGFWLLLAPLVLGFPTRLVAAGNSMLVGLLLLAATLGAIVARGVWQHWTKACLAVWLMISPAFLQLRTQAGVANSIVTGMIVLTLVLWAVQDQELAKGYRPPSPL